MTFFTQELFDTYAPEKQSSMVHNLKRMQAKDGLSSFAAPLLNAIADNNSKLILSSLTKNTTDEIPNITNQKKVSEQLLYWFRSPQERNELATFMKEIKLDQSALMTLGAHHKHPIISLRIDQHGFSVNYTIPAASTLDQKNCISKLNKSWEMESFIKLLDAHNGVPFNFTVKSAANELIYEAPVDTINNDTSTALIEAIKSKTDNTICISNSYTIEEAIASEAAIQNSLVQLCEYLAGIYKFLTWSKQNDHIEANKAIAAQKLEEKKRAAGYREGDKVRVIGGLFKGKWGIVEAIDHKANLRIRVGKMTVNLPGAQVRAD